MIAGLWHALFLAAALTGFVLGLALLWANGASGGGGFRGREWSLALVVWLYSVSLVEAVFFWSGWYREFHYLLGISVGFPLLYGPIFVQFIRRRLGLPAEPAWRRAVRFIPPAAALAYLAPYYLSTRAERLDFAAWYADPIKALLIPVAGIVSLVAGSLVAGRLLRAQDQRIQKSHIVWLRRSLAGFAAYAVFAAVHFVLVLFGLMPATGDQLIALLMVASIFALAWAGIATSRLFDGAGSGLRYRTSSIDASSSGRIFDEIEALMRHRKPYLTPGLKLNDVAGMLGLGANQVSQAINQNAGLNFAAYVNRYRVTAAHAMLPRARSVMEAAYQAGFNNKTTFYKAFGDTYGCSPSSLVRNQRDALERGNRATGQ